MLGEIVADSCVVASDGEIRGPEQLFLAVAQRVADGLLHLRIGEPAQAGSFAGNQFQNADAVFQNDGWANLPRLQRHYNFFQHGIGLVEG